MGALQASAKTVLGRLRCHIRHTKTATDLIARFCRVAAMASSRRRGGGDRRGSGGLWCLAEGSAGDDAAWWVYSIYSGATGVEVTSKQTRHLLMSAGCVSVCQGSRCFNVSMLCRENRFTAAVWRAKSLEEQMGNITLTGMTRACLLQSQVGSQAKADSTKFVIRVDSPLWALYQGKVSS